MKNSAVVLALILVSSTFVAAQNVHAASNGKQPDEKKDSKQSPCALSAVVMSLPPSSTGTLWSNPESSKDTQASIKKSVQDNCPSFSSDKALSAVEIKVSDNRIVISGSVPTDRDEEVLLTIAQTVADGRTVFNRLNVAANGSLNAGGVAGSNSGTAGSISSPTDNSTVGKTGSIGVAKPTATDARVELGRQIDAALHNEPTLAKGNVGVKVADDEIVLSGTVSSDSERQLAKRIVAAYASDRRVVDQIRIEHR